MSKLKQGNRIINLNNIISEIKDNETNEIKQHK